MSFRRGPRTPSTPKFSTNNNRRNPAYSTTTTSPSSRGGLAKTQPRGLFADGSWHCDCTPRLPAEHFRVKKEGKNHGRWFYTCQNGEGKRCGFFLWDEDAKVREEGAVLNGKTTEVGREGEMRAEQERVLKERTLGGGGEGQANPVWKEMVGGAGGLLGKRGREVDAEETTPSKRSKTTGLQTPVTITRRKLPWMMYPDDDDDDDDNNDDSGGTPSKTDRVNAAAAAAPPPTPRTTDPSEVQDPSSSPTTGRFRDAMRSPPGTGVPGGGGGGAKSLHAEVFDLLRDAGVTLGDKVASDLGASLNRHEMKLQGVLKGRDLVRTALKAKEAGIAELQAKLVGAEAEREALRGALAGFGGRGGGGAV